MASTPGFYKIKKGDDEFDDDLSEMDSVLDDTPECQRLR